MFFFNTLYLYILFSLRPVALTQEILEVPTADTILFQMMGRAYGIHLQMHHGTWQFVPIPQKINV